MIKAIIEIAGQQVHIIAESLQRENDQIIIFGIQQEKRTFKRVTLETPISELAPLKISGKKKKKRIAVTKEKNCCDCGNDFLPTSNVQKRCVECKKKLNSQKN